MTDERVVCKAHDWLRKYRGLMEEEVFLFLLGLVDERVMHMAKRKVEVLKFVGIKKGPNPEDAA